MKRQVRDILPVEYFRKGDDDNPACNSEADSHISIQIWKEYTDQVAISIINPSEVILADWRY